MNDNGFNPLYSHLLSSYGHQLEYASVRDMSQIELKTVVEACPNAQFELAVDRSSLLPALNIIGRQLDRAFLYRSGGGCVQEELGRAWKRCSNLKEILVL